MNRSDWPTSLTDTELDELDKFLRAHAGTGRLLLDGVHGLLTALAVGPEKVLPDEWLPQVLHDPFADENEGARMLHLLAKLNDSIPAELGVDAYEPILGEVEDEGVLALSAGGWCEGFSRGIDMRAALWENRLGDDPTLMELLGPIMALAVDEGVLAADAEFDKLTDDEYDDCLTQVPMVLAAVAQYWRAQAPSADEQAAAEAARIAVIQADEDDGDEPPPRQRSGHWLH